jgi:hypothetical protein
MRGLHLSAFALILALGLPPRVSAQAVTCKDGSSSETGRGACSHHGGVATVAATVSCRDGSVSSAGRGACSHHGGVGPAVSTRSRSSTPSRPSRDETSPVPAPSNGGEIVNCRDGTTSSAGRGACSHHGGVGTASARANRTETSPSSTPTSSGEAVTCRDGTTSSAGRGACSHHGGVEAASTHTATRAPEPKATERDIPPPPPTTRANASALCKDGTYSQSAQRSGACSHHGGVQQWLKDLPAHWW